MDHQVLGPCTTSPPCRAPGPVSLAAAAWEPSPGEGTTHLTSHSHSTPCAYGTLPYQHHLARLHLLFFSIPPLRLIFFSFLLPSLQQPSQTHNPRVRLVLWLQPAALFIYSHSLPTVARHLLSLKTLLAFF